MCLPPTVGLLIPATFMIATGYTTDKHTAIAFLTLAVAGASPAVSGFNINHLDISPRFAGVLMGKWQKPHPYFCQY